MLAKQENISIPSIRPCLQQSKGKVPILTKQLMECPCVSQFSWSQVFEELVLETGKGS